MAINISIVGDASKAIREAEKTGDALSDVVGEMERMDDAGRDLGDGVERGLDGAGDEAETFEKKMRSAFTEAEKQARDAGRKIGTSTSDGFDRASAGADEFRDEANSTAREAAASFDGSAESIGDAFQEVAANAFAGFGPAGAAAGLAIAAGLGIAITKLQDLAEENTEAKEAAAELGQAYIDAGGDIEKLEIAEKIKSWGTEVNEDNWMTFWVDEAKTNFEKYAELAAEAGESTGESLRALNGTYEESAAWLDATREKQEQLTEAIADGTTVTADGVTIRDASAQAAYDEQVALNELTGQVESNMEQHESAVEMEQIYAESIEGTREAVERKNEALEEQADLLGESITSELDYKNALSEANEVIAENGETLNTNTEQGRENWETLIDLADKTRSFRDAQMEAGVPVATLNERMITQRVRFIQAAEAAGMEEDAARALADQLGLVPSEVPTNFVETGAAHVKSEAADLERQPDIPIGVQFMPDTTAVENERWFFTNNPVTQKVYFQPINNMITRPWN